MEDFHRAGGLLAVLREVADLLDPDALTVTGRPLVDYLDDAPIWDPEVIRPRDRAAAARRRHRRAARQPRPGRCRHQAGRRHRRRCCSTAAAPWSSTASRTCTPASTTPTSTSTPTRCWCCAAAVRGATRACRRWRTCRCRPSCSQQGVRDMVRICDGRMSGTAYGTVVLHVAPEAAAGGPLGAGADRRLDRARRGRPAARHRRPGRASSRPGTRRRPRWRGSPRPSRGWEQLYVEHVMQADTGADLDFLVGSSGDEVSRESH